MFFVELSGYMTMLNYTTTIFAQSGSNWSPNTSAIIVGAIQLLGTYTSILLIDRVGRKVIFDLTHWQVRLTTVDMFRSF